MPINPEVIKPGRVVELDPFRVEPFETQPRKRFRGIRQLAQSIKAIGQITPIIVLPTKKPRYDAKLVDGERRLRACLLAHLPIKAVFESDAKEADRYARAVAANFCRQSHDAVEILEAILALKTDGKTNEQIAQIFGKTVGWVSQFSTLQKLAPEVLDALKISGDEEKTAGHRKRERGRMSLTLALPLAGLPHVQQVKAMRMILKKRMSHAEARTYIAKTGAKTGARLGRLARSPTERFRSLATAVETCFHVVDRYVDMPGCEIAPMIRSATRAERKRLAKRLESLCESLLLVSDALDKD